MPIKEQQVADSKVSFEQQRYVSPGDMTTIRATDTRSNENQNAVQPSLAQDSSSNNKSPTDLALNPSRIEVGPTTLASLRARGLEGARNKEPNTVNCASFGVRGGRRCRHGGYNSEGPIPNMQDGGYGPRTSNNLDTSELTRRDKGFESHPCSNPDLKDEWFCKNGLSSRDTETLSKVPVVDTIDANNDIVHGQDPKFDYHNFLAGHESSRASFEDMKAAIKAHQTEIRNRARARTTALAVGITVPVVICVCLLGFIAWYLRKRSKKLASARGRVAELELETRRESGAHGSEVGKP
jgi:hypothetical protein